MATREEAVMSAFNDEIITMKKKIQLSEGQRKAEYEEFDAKKRKMTSQIRALKKEIRERSSAKPSQFIDLDLLKTCGKSMKELKTFEGRTPEEVIELLDLQCIDLQKKIDLSKYEFGKKKERYSASLKQMKELTEESAIETVLPLYGNDGQLTKLENKIHEAGLHLLEMRHLEKKYTKMRQSLLDDRVFFQSTLEKYEEEIAKQAKEIEHLQSVRDEAVRLREKTKRKLAKLEAQAVAQGVEREQQLQEIKKRVEESRAYLERVQRSLVLTGKGPQIDSGEGDDGADVEQQSREALQAKLQKLKEVTGAKDEEDIIQKLKTQKLTKERLLKLKASVENEKKKLELEKEQLEAELEAVKFSEVKEKEQNEEEYEMHDRALKQALEEIEEARSKHTKEKLKLSGLKKQLVGISSCLQITDNTIPDSDEDAFAEEEEDTYMDDLIKLAKDKFNEMIQGLENLNLQDAVEEPLSSLYIDTGLAEDPQGSKRGEGSDRDEKSAEEVVDIPSREYLKRQSQMMVETQGKRKGYSK